MPSLSTSRILVTGAAGFIGSHLVDRLLREGCAVRALAHYNALGSWGNLDRPEMRGRRDLEVVLGDLADPGSVGAAVEGCDVVFHLGALIGIPYSYRAPHSYVAVNIGGTLNVLEACRRHAVARLVHVSTSEVYGSALRSPMDEAHPQRPQSPYSASKIGADALVTSFHATFGLPAAIVRPFNTYGPRQSARAVIPTIVLQALAGAEVRLGALHPVRDLTYVEDTVEALVLAARCEAAVGEVVHLGSGAGISVGDLAARILALMGLEGKRAVVVDGARVRPERSEVAHLLCDASKARRLLGWSPAVPLDEGLRRTIRFLEENRDRYKPEVYGT